LSAPSQEKEALALPYPVISEIIERCLQHMQTVPVTRRETHLALIVKFMIKAYPNQGAPGFALGEAVFEILASESLRAIQSYTQRSLSKNQYGPDDASEFSPLLTWNL
jgi:hypothetical protein